MICITPSSRRGIREIRFEMMDLNQKAASGRKKADSVGSKTGVGVLDFL